RALEAAVAGRRIWPETPPPSCDISNEAEGRFRLCQLAATVLGLRDRDTRTIRQARVPDLLWARELLAAIEVRIANGNQDLVGLLPAVQAEIAVAAAECDANEASADEQSDPLFRLRIERWAVTQGDLADLVCVRDPSVRTLAFDFDVVELMAVRSTDDLMTPPTLRRSHIVAFGCSGVGRRDPLVVDGATARILELSDGTRSASDIVAELNREGHLTGDGIGLKWVENLFACGLILLQ